MNRAFEPGYRCVCMHDGAMRRGLWYRYDVKIGTIEICSGREGDDEYLKIVDKHVAKALNHVLEAPTVLFEDHAMNLIDLFQLQGESYLTAKKQG